MGFLYRISKRYSNIKFHENPGSVELFHPEKQRDRHWQKDRNTANLEVAFHNFVNPPKKTAKYAVSDRVCRIHQEVLYCQNSYRFTVHTAMQLNLHASLRRFSRNSQMLDIISRRHTSNFTKRSINVEGQNKNLLTTLSKEELSLRRLSKYAGI